MTDAVLFTNRQPEDSNRIQPRTSLLYQLRVRSDFEMWGSAVSGSGCDVEFVRADCCAARPFTPIDSTRKYENRAAGVTLHRQDGWHCLRYAGVGDFFFRDARRVVCHLAETVSGTLVASLLHGPVSAVLLELRGATCLHASAVQIGGRAVALVGHSGSGKSSFAARLVADGYPLVTDDILPVTIGQSGCIASPGYPRMKIRPDMAGPFATPAPEDSALGKHLQPVGQGWGCFADRPLPFAAAYLLERGDPLSVEASIEELNPGNRFVEMVRFSFCARVVRSLGLEAIRFRGLGKIAERIAIYRFRYAGGVGNLPAACRALVAHAESR